ncbi:hypothetical protein DDB_G0273245 [Dictyostelium discoideum AX4]|uniref:Ankyrin repeat-containing protein n=1 Tax=Dictyostelium discoideum TaxID=44689 RepID=Q557C6_DICDI|nr:hypothetical protein DDB_G0273653 [Dictyostelium discoideum AX4]XP_644807.1 hypothetical protein DDB_G0273245 [Dictyostelium discoideum AX4]EAL70517.1 hypothetical protein DDB_G0273653 [Dictyostelium discoideum AX4]EAL70840.1 hypothetical protein DDB_G0273245 [Dictyostelium discoideum AX4]|eukprot:XP_644443.1 hypothetical protein DDB_G0273653 [Dictyostelium discoideum AX4]
MEINNSNNNINNNNDNNINDFKIYKLYKLVFKNIYISRLIFNYVYLINEQITNSSQNSKFTEVLNFKQASFDWIIINKHYQLLLYKIQMNTVFTGFTFENLINCINLIQSNNINNNENFIKVLKQFYKTNLNQLINNTKLLHEYPTPSSLTMTIKETINNLLLSKYKTTQSVNIKKGISLIALSIHSENFDFLKIVYQESINDLTTPISGSLKNQLSMSVGDKDGTADNGGCEGGLLEIALLYGNMDIIKFVHLKLDIAIKNPWKSLIYSLKSENRSNAIQYLLEDLKFNIPKIEYPSTYNRLNVPYYYFQNLLKLPFNLFKKLYDLNIPLFFDSHKYSMLFNHFDDSTINNNKIKFQDYLEFIKVSIFSLTVSSIDQIKKNSLILKKIQYLINYNNNNENENNNNKFNYNLYILKEIDLIKYNKSSKIILGENNFLEHGKLLLTNLISKPKFNNTIKNYPIECSFGNFTNINFKDFNLEREIKRVFLFDFLYFNNHIQPENKFNQIVNFVRTYKEFHLIEHLSSTTEIIKSSILISHYYADSYLIENIIKYNTNNSKIFSFNPTFDKFKLKDIYFFDQVNINLINKLLNDNNGEGRIIISIEKKIEFLNQLIQLGANGFIRNYLKFIIKSEFDSKNFKIPEHAELIIGSINEYINKNKIQLIKSKVTFTNLNVLKYFYYNYKDYFIWDSIKIGRNCLKTKDLEIIKFIHFNSIGNLNCEYCIDTSTATFMINNLGYTFYSFSLNHLIYSLDNYNSNYLFQYVINYLISNGIEISIDYSLILNNYFHCKLIESKVIDGSLTKLISPNYYNRKIVNADGNDDSDADGNGDSGGNGDDDDKYVKSKQELYEVFRIIYDLNMIMTIGNYQIIKQFFKEFANATNREDYFLLLSAKNIKKIKSTPQSSPIKLLFKKSDFILNANNLILE